MLDLCGIPDHECVPMRHYSWFGLIFVPLWLTVITWSFSRPKYGFQGLLWCARRESECWTVWTKKSILCGIYMIVHKATLVLVQRYTHLSCSIASTFSFVHFYQQLAKKHHPDTNKEDPNAEKKFQEIQKAYEVCRICSSYTC